MKDEYLKVYQLRIEEIKSMDASPEEKRKLAADAKTEILEQYKTSYIEEEKKSANPEPVVQPSEIAKEENPDPIDNILNKFEERTERGEVGVTLEMANETDDLISDPETLFTTMNLNDLFGEMDLSDDDIDTSSSDDNDEIIANFDDLIMSSDQLFAGFFDDEEDEEPGQPASPLSEFDLDAEDNSESSNLNSETLKNQEVIDSFEFEVDEIVELSQGTILEDDVIATEETLKPTVEVQPADTQIEEKKASKKAKKSKKKKFDDADIEEVSAEEVLEITRELGDASINELEEIEKERERAQKLGVIEMALLVILIILVVIVVRLIVSGV